MKGDNVKRVLYLNYCGNDEMTLDAIGDLAPQVDKIFMVNTTFKKLETGCAKIVQYMADEDLSFQQSVNICIRHANFNRNVMIWAHTDVRVKPGAVDALFKRLNEVKNEKWWAIFSLYDTLCLMNPAFFVQENYWGDENLFPWYFSDNVRGMVAKLRGWKHFECPEAAAGVVHLGSQTLKKSKRMDLVNGITFPQIMQRYAKIMGGMADKETVTDPGFGGIFPVPTKEESERFNWTTGTAPGYAFL